MNTISLLITIVAVILGLIFKKSRSIAFLLLTLLFILFTFEYTQEGDGDYYNYEQVFEMSQEGLQTVLLGYEPTFVLFFSICQRVGLDFVATKGVLAFIVVFLLYKTIRTYTKNSALVLSLFFIFPALYDAELMRWLLAESIAVYGFKYLIRGNSIKDNLLYTLFIIIAFLFHSGCIIYIVFLLSALKNKRRTLIIVFGISIVILLVRSVTPLYSILGIFMGDNMNGKWQGGYVGNFNAVIASTFFYCLVLSTAYVPCFLTGYKPKVFEQISNNKYGKLLCSKIMMINYIAFIFVAMNIFSAQVERMYHVVILLNFITLSVKCEEGKNHFGGILSVFLVSIVLLVYKFSDSTMPVLKSHFTIGYLSRMMELVFGIS